MTADQLREIKRELGLTNAGLAEALCMAEVSVKRMMTEAQPIAPSTVRAVVTLLYFHRRKRLKPSYDELLAEYV